MNTIELLSKKYTEVVRAIAEESLEQESPSAYALESVSASEWTFKTPLMAFVMSDRGEDQQDLETAFDVMYDDVQAEMSS